MRVVIGLGANLGDRLATLREALRRIERIAPVQARSSLFETTPVGGPPQPDFLNAAVMISWSREPSVLLDALMQIEHDLGRVREIPDGPRTIDLDILWIDGRIVDEPRLVVPHPRLTARAFALAPMLEVVPDAVDPLSGEPYVAPDQHGIRRLEDTL